MDLDVALESGRSPREHLHTLKVILGIIIGFSVYFTVFREFRVLAFLPANSGVVESAYSTGRKAVRHFIKLDSGDPVEVTERMLNRAKPGMNVSWKANALWSDFGKVKVRNYRLLPIILAVFAAFALTQVLSETDLAIRLSILLVEEKIGGIPRILFVLLPIVLITIFWDF